MTTAAWDDESFARGLGEAAGTHARDAVYGVIGWCVADGLPFGYGGGSNGTFSPRIEIAGQVRRLFEVWTNGFLYPVGYLWGYPPFGRWEGSTAVLLSRDRCDELVDRMNGLHPGIVLPPGSFFKQPRVPVADFRDPAALGRLVAAYRWVIEQLWSACLPAPTSGCG